MSLMIPYIQHAHFYPDGGPSYAIRSFYDSRNKMDQQESLHTTQMALLDHENIRMYHVYIHEPGYDVWLTNNGHGWDCDETPKDLRYEHNLYRLWACGEFSSSPDDTNADTMSVGHIRGGEVAEGYAVIDESNNCVVCLSLDEAEAYVREQVVKVRPTRVNNGPEEQTWVYLVPKRYTIRKTNLDGSIIDYLMGRCG